MTPPEPDPRDGIPEDVLKAAVERELQERQVKRDAKSTARQRQGKLPTAGRYRSISSGAYKRRQRPVAKVEDRQYVPGALRHWRMVHGGVSMHEAQARIGYSPKSSTWQQWEDGIVAPPYLALLKILAATGLGYWTEHGLPQAGTTGEVRLAALNTHFRDQRAARRKKAVARKRPKRL